ncbi:MAG: asparagine synthetase B family protein [Bacteroidia bacterium]|nr:MAG: asparagine synthetase B family protein [Bacteroidia bacterium]
MSCISLVYNDGFSWVKENNISFKGYVYDQDGNFLADSGAISLFREISDRDALLSLMQGLDGAFSVIIRLENRVLIAVDAMSMFSLYYSPLEDGWLISDSAHVAGKKLPELMLNTEAIPEFQTAGFVVGNETLFRNVFKTQAGEVLVLQDDGSLQRECYHYYLPSKFYAAQPEQLSGRLKDILQGVSDRLMASLRGRTAVIPLSGGYDSRLIATMLKKANYRDVVCFTYGKPNRESVLSQKVAEGLGYPWVFVDYRDLDMHAYLADPIFLDYCDQVGNATSMPFLQEFFAVKHMHERGMIPDDAIFIPGHTGDYIAGSYVEKTIRKENAREYRPNTIARRYFGFRAQTGDERKHITGRLEKWFSDYAPPRASIDDSYDIYTEDWDLKEKFSKFVFNAAGVFPFFGYEFRFPLWDRDFRNFFRGVPFSLRSYKLLYDSVLEEAFFKPQGVCFGDQELKERPGDLRMQQLRKFLRPFIPGHVRERRMIERDYLMYHTFTGAMKKEMTDKGIVLPSGINHFNAIICHWYVMKTKEFTQLPR